MKTHTAPPAPAPAPAVRLATPAQLGWLSAEISSWQAEGLLRDDQAAAILGSYRASRRFTLGRMLLALGGTFVGVGLIWLVAANIDSLPPLARFALVTTVWLALVAASHVGAERRLARGRTDPSPVIGAGRLLAALAYGAVVFQAAQSLQVPAYEPVLVGVWSAGALVYAYAVRAVMPLLVGVVTGVVWVVWQSMQDSPDALSFVVAVLCAAAAASGASALHDRFGPEGFASAWREAAALLALVALFAAAIPDLTSDQFEVDATLVVVAGLAVALGAAGVAFGRGSTRLEPLAVGVVALAAIGLVLWEPSQAALDGADTVPAGDWLQAVLSVAVYVAAATWVAVLGIWRDSDRLTYLALAALVIFTVFQSFAVFARIIDGAWLFVALGAVLFGAGFLFDRGRRQLEAALEGSTEGAQR